MKSVSNKGKQSTRETVLHTLKFSPRAKIEEIARAANVSPVTVRHHLNSLQADGLVEVESVRCKVGRPYYTYSLSEAGHELFPQKYYSLANRLIEEIKNTLPPETVNQIFAGLVQRIITRHEGEFENLTFEERLDYVVTLLESEGFLARWEKTEDGYQITEYSCPYLSVGQIHEEVCTLDTHIILSILGEPVQQKSCMLNGDNCCEFTVAVNGNEENLAYSSPPFQ